VFHTIPPHILKRMQELEAMDARDRQDGTNRFDRLRQIPPETGRFLALLAASAPNGTYLEIGTSGGYSALWLSLACREVGRKITTLEFSKAKLRLAGETFSKAEVTDVVQLVKGDARQLLAKYQEIAFCFLDAEKDHYLELYEVIVPRMITGGLLVADNVISHRHDLEGFIGRVLSDDRVDAVLVPIERGELVCRKI
jgi:caffeoyl-CoA O-methyltransferase